MKMFWTGTDSLMLVDVSKRSFRKKIVWIIFRWIVKFLDRFYVEEHYVDAEWLSTNLAAFGVTKPVRVMKDKIKYSEKLPRKVTNDRFVVMYYLPGGALASKFKKWLYGFDIYLQIKHQLTEHTNTPITYIMVTGKTDMNSLLPYVDAYIRPNRHDGSSRLVQECELQGIPVLRTHTDTLDEETIRSFREWIKTMVTQKKANELYNQLNLFEDEISR